MHSQRGKGFFLRNNTVPLGKSEGKSISTNIVFRRREKCVSVDKTLQILHSDWVKSLLAIKFAKWSLKRVFTHSLAAVVRV